MGACSALQSRYVRALLVQVWGQVALQRLLLEARRQAERRSGSEMS